MKHPAPRFGTPATFHFEAARDGRLMLPYCDACTRFHWPVQAHCPHCGQQPGWRQAAGQGRIASWSVVVRAVNPELKDDAPYIIAFVELPEGVRLFSNIVDVAPDQVHGGQTVQCRFEPSMEPELWVPVFAPVQD